jgi:hypothetical protein
MKLSRGPARGEEEDEEEGKEGKGEMRLSFEQLMDIVGNGASVQFQRQTKR